MPINPGVWQVGSGPMMKNGGGEFEEAMKGEDNRSAPQIDLTKIGVAQRQLNAAIRLTLQGEDHVAIHTIAAAAYRILRDVKDKRGRSELSDLWANSLFKVATDFLTGVDMPEVFAEDAYLMEVVQDVVQKIKIGEVKTANDIFVKIAEDQQKSYWRKFNTSANFLKHADKDIDESLR
jgi:hypothetical protein